MEELSEFSIGEDGNAINPEFKAAQEKVVRASRKAKRRLFVENAINLSAKIGGSLLCAGMMYLAVRTRNVPLGILSVLGGVSVWSMFRKGGKGIEHELLEQKTQILDIESQVLENEKSENFFPEVPHRTQQHLKDDWFYNQQKHTP